MSKLKVNEAFIKRAKKVFEDADKQTIKTGEGLTRTELRVLENRRLVKKRRVFGKRKFSDVTPTISYVWEWIGE